MKSKVSSDVFLLSKALITANSVRADISKVENTLRTLGYKDKELFKLLGAMHASADIVHSIVNDEHTALCEHLDSCISGCRPSACCDCRVDNDADEETTATPSQNLLHCKFVAGNWYCIKQHGSTAFLHVISRDKYHVPYITGIVRDHGKDLSIRVRVHVSHSHCWLGEPTEYVRVSLGRAHEPEVIVSSSNWVSRDTVLGDQ